jgi:ABC-type multidrug transport system fused ATPase/permease subunit
MTFLNALFVYVYRYGMFTRAATRGERYQSSLASSQVEESLRSIQVVKAHGYEQQEQQRYNSQLQKLVQLAYLKLAGYTVRTTCIA